MCCIPALHLLQLLHESRITSTVGHTSWVSKKLIFHAVDRGSSKCYFSAWSFQCVSSALGSSLYPKPTGLSVMHPFPISGPHFLVSAFTCTYAQASLLLHHHKHLSHHSLALGVPTVQLQMLAWRASLPLLLECRVTYHIKEAPSSLTLPKKPTSSLSFWICTHCFPLIGTIKCTLLSFLAFFF